MSDNRNGQTIFLSVIGIATLLVAIIGATFAYFTTTINNGSSNVEAITGTVGKVTYTSEAINFNAEGAKMLPGAVSGNKTLTVKLSQSDFDVKYSCYLNVTGNEITDMYLHLTDSTDDAKKFGADMGDAEQQVPKVAYEVGVEGDDDYAAAEPAQKVKIAEGTLSSGDEKTLTYSLEFRETGYPQTDEGKKLNATVTCQLDDVNGVYYNAANPSGKPLPYTPETPGND